jgi:hypothetical protein
VTSVNGLTGVVTGLAPIDNPTFTGTITGTLSGNATNITGTLAVSQGGTGATATTGTGNSVLATNPIFGGPFNSTTPTPSAVNATATLTAGNLRNQIITSTSALATNLTLPTGSSIDSTLAGGGSLGVTAPDGLAWDWSIINTGPNLVTVLAGTGHTVVGTMTVPTLTSGRFRTRKTSTSTYVTYRL